MKLLVVVTLLFASASAYAGAEAKDLVGIWQDSAMIAAAWSENYRFFPNGTVLWGANAMDLDKKLISRRGTWTLRGEDLRLLLTEETVLIGGRFQPEKGGDGMSSWIGAKAVDRKIPEPIIQLTKVGAVTNRNGYPSTILFKQRWWRMRPDPNNYD